MAGRHSLVNVWETLLSCLKKVIERSLRSHPRLRELEGRLGGLEASKPSAAPALKFKVHDDVHVNNNHKSLIKQMVYSTGTELSGFVRMKTGEWATSSSQLK